jgi:hypothetical protein
MALIELEAVTGFRLKQHLDGHPWSSLPEDVWAAIAICPLAANRRCPLMAISSRRVLAPEEPDGLAKCCPRRALGDRRRSSVFRVRDPRALPAGPTGGPMRIGGGAGLTTVGQMPATGARESNL